ncbi:MAG: aminoglycoside phosphotransferase family protein [Actinomycetota bacterium]
MVTPPPALHDWIAELTGARRPSVGSPLPGASTATIWPVTAGGRQLVAKVYDLGIEGVGPDDVRRDAAAMRAAEELGLVAPRLLGADAAGERLGVPAVVMTRLEGEPRAHGRPDPLGWVDGLADVLIAVGRAGTPTEPLHSRRPWFALPVEPPSWTRDAAPWDEMNAALSEPLPAGPVGFIHRDVHQLNVVWADGEPVGLVDWVNGCLGPIESDIACLRLNIALAEDDHDAFVLADRLLDRCLEAGLPWHPLWDLEWIAGSAAATTVFLAGVDLGARMSLDGVRRVFDDAVPRALDAAARWNR